MTSNIERHKDAVSAALEFFCAICGHDKSKVNLEEIWEEDDGSFRVVFSVPVDSYVFSSQRKYSEVKVNPYGQIPYVRIFDKDKQV